ncbi:MAG: hypothetical protein U0Z70_16955 [Thermomicrobiales bacterium]|nr:hypothetical protein [Chloroflexia bacterium]
MSKVNATTIQTWAGIGLILASGAIHALGAQEMFGEVQYMGVLFALSVIGAVAAAIGIWRGERWGWQLGALVAGGSILAYLITRTIGFPGFRENSWEEFSEPIGVLSLVVEGLFVATAAWVMTAHAATRTAHAVSS